MKASVRNNIKLNKYEIVLKSKKKYRVQNRFDFIQMIQTLRVVLVELCSNDEPVYSIYTHTHTLTHPCALFFRSTVISFTFACRWRSKVFTQFFRAIFVKIRLNVVCGKGGEATTNMFSRYLQVH